MIPFYILIVLLIVFRAASLVGIRQFSTFQDAAVPALAAMFLFTGITHFTNVKLEYLAMIPPPIPRELWIIHLTGVLEIAGALGLLIPGTRKFAGIGLALLLFLMFPANLYAAVNEIPFRGRPATNLWLRVPVQVVFVSLLVWVSGTGRRPQSITSPR